MKKLNTLAVLFASAALAAPISAFAQSSVDNWRSGDSSMVWKNGTNELCWRDSNQICHVTGIPAEQQGEYKDDEPDTTAADGNRPAGVSPAPVLNLRGIQLGFFVKWHVFFLL